MSGHNFFNSIIFLTIFNALDTVIGKIQFLLNAKKYRAFPLDLACLEGLSVIVAIQLELKNNKKISPLCFVFESHVTNYIKKVCSLMFSH
jgi:hypothetical protein